MTSLAITLPFMNINFHPNATEGCITGMCNQLPKDGRRSCTVVPQDFETALNKKVCSGGRSDFDMAFDNIGGVTLQSYTSKCTFDNQACATSVCDLQRSTVNQTQGGKWTCLSDPAIGDYATKGLYWFQPANGSSSPCVGSGVKCDGILAQVSSATPRPLGASLLLLVVLSCALAVMDGAV